MPQTSDFRQNGLVGAVVGGGGGCLGVRKFGAASPIGRIIDRVGHIDSVPSPSPPAATPLSHSEVDGRKGKGERHRFPGLTIPQPPKANRFLNARLANRFLNARWHRAGCPNCREKHRPIQVENAPLSTHATIS